MTFLPPTPSTLRAMAGWAISRKEGASDAQSLALGRFRDGCEDLSENYPEASVVVVGQVEKVPVRELQGPSSISLTREELPEFVESLRNPLSVCEQGLHKISLHTQRCGLCGKSFREIRGRESEFVKGTE